MPKPIATWSPVRDVWEVETTGLFCEHSDVFSETWPTSGMTRNGMAYALPTSAPLTDDSGSSSLLGTPRSQHGTERNSNIWERDLSQPQNLENQLARLLPTPSLSMADRGGAHPDSRAGHTVNLQDVAQHLLGTPTARMWKGSSSAQRASGADKARLEDQVALLPTPRATDGTKGGPNQRGSSGDLMLPSAVHTIAQGAATRLASTTGPDMDALTLLPTPTATPYGNNQSASPGATVRPSLDTLALTLLPTPRALDSTGVRGVTRNRTDEANARAGLTLTDVLVGDSTVPPLPDGNTPSDE